MTKKIMLACSAGMSTSLLVTKMQQAAEDAGEDVTIFATAAADALAKLDSEHPDVLMLGPQVKYMLDDFQKEAACPVAVINMRDYGLMNGPKVLKEALTLANNG
ncbi:PTS sugar transporter subunit IIB [Lacticaseibacillus hulanensis]|jgi:PTS system cellobiose-specific IIB component|uniref:PTS sugar transporter subunit IIB n=1 Tax=Lacticaseibacillus hulanensis TaxID=2493111 RepID=UPI001F4D3E6C|nr:PTS sugar transporter subunit IIB [Lacticaseibacillus hulanensis]